MIVHGCSSEEVNSRVVRKLIWHNGRAILNMYPVINVVQVIHKALIVHPLPRLLNPVSIRVIARVYSRAPKLMNTPFEMEFL